MKSPIENEDVKKQRVILSTEKDLSSEVLKNLKRKILRHFVPQDDTRKMMTREKCFFQSLFSEQPFEKAEQQIQKQDAAGRSKKSDNAINNVLKLHGAGLGETLTDLNGEANGKNRG